MGGSKTKTITDVQVVGLMDSYGELRKMLLLEAGKHINSGMGTVMATYGQQIVQMKGLYNDGYLTAFGYNPNESVLIDKLDEETILGYTINNIDTLAIDISNIKFKSLSILDQALLHIQNYENYNSLNRSFTFTDGSIYYYLNSLQNGQYIDISIYKNKNETVTSYLDANYETYTILTQSDSVVNVDGTLVWQVEIEYEYIVIEDIDGVPTEVTYIDTAFENIDLDIKYLQIDDIEYIFMSNLMAEYSEDNIVTISKEIIIADVLDIEYIDVSVSVICTYIGNGEYSVVVTATNLSYQYSWQYEAMENLKANIKQNTIISIEKSISNNTRKIVWDYTININTSKMAYTIISEHPEFYTQVSASAMPIIPLKRNGSFINNDKQNIILKQIGLEGEDFTNTLNSQEISDAFITFGVPCTDTNISSVMYIYEFLTHLSNIRESLNFGATRVVKKVSVSFDGLDIQQTYGIDVSIVNDSSHKLGEYWYEGIEGAISRTTTDGDGNTVTEYIPTIYPVYCKQEGEDYYIKVVRTSIESTLIVGGIVKRWGVIDTTGNQMPITDEVRYPLIKDIFILLPINNYADVLERSMSIVFNSIQTYKTKWYQSGFFKFIMIIVATIIFVYTGVNLYSFVLYVASVASTMGIDLGVVGDIIAVVSIIYGGYNLIQNGVQGMQGGLQLANTVLNAVNTVNNWYFEKDMKKMMSALAQSSNMLEEEQKKLEEETSGFIEGGLSMFNDNRTVDGYYNFALANFDQYKLMYDMPYDYDRFYR